MIAAGKYLIKKYGVPNRRLEIDRIDNNKGYAPGNIRFVTRQQNARNRRVTVLSEFHQMYWPYVENVVYRKLISGMTREEIIESARLAVKEKRKNWRLIEARLEFMIYEMPESITVLPYRTC